VVGEVCAVGAKLTDGAAGPERHLNWPVALGIHGRKEERHTAGCFRCFFVAACCTGTAHLGEALGCTGRPRRWLEGAHGTRAPRRGAGDAGTHEMGSGEGTGLWWWHAGHARLQDDFKMGRWQSKQHCARHCLNEAGAVAPLAPSRSGEDSVVAILTPSRSTCWH
jgi:hypothetical protein